jgi:hypothetical protein
MIKEKDNLIQIFTQICGTKNVIEDPEILKDFSKDLGFIKGKIPKLLIRASKTEQIIEILKLANHRKLFIVPISSSSKLKHHGDTIPRKENSIIIDLTKMNKILSIDKKNRVVMIEPGVTFEQLIPKLKREGLRLLTPLYPTGSKSVVTSALEREPITIPRYHWDSSDPLLCTEVVFGTGDLFRTGTAAGPGTLSQQKKMGRAQVNPMGPTQFSPFRVIQGAQGSLGIVTWATLKLELNPTIQEVFHYHSNNIEELLDFQQQLAKYRLCDETFIMNRLNLAAILKKTREEIAAFSKSLLNWNLIYVLSGKGDLAPDKLDYLEGDVNEILIHANLEHLKAPKLIDNEELLRSINGFTFKPWRLRFRDSYQDIFFISKLENIPKYIEQVNEKIPENLGVYIQPINQGTSYHCEFDYFYDYKNELEKDGLEKKLNDIRIDLMENGAFFNRPYGSWAKEVFKHQSEQTTIALKKVKSIFDPNKVLNPGVLCFDD